jgi:hypothetical protein
LKGALIRCAPAWQMGHGLLAALFPALPLR